MGIINRLPDTVIESELSNLNVDTNEHWKIIEGKLSKTLIFKDFMSAMAFMQTAADAAEAMNHHPEWCNIYNRLTVNLTTHSVGGISKLDFALARKLEACLADNVGYPTTKSD